MDEAFLYDDLLGGDDDALLGVSFTLDEDLLAGEDEDTALMQAVLGAPDAGRAQPSVFARSSAALAGAGGHVATGAPALQSRWAAANAQAAGAALTRQARGPVSASASSAAAAAMAKQRRQLRRQSINAARMSTPAPAPAPRTAARGRKGKAKGVVEMSAKELERKRRNRESAALSRKRKRMYAQQLESEVEELTRQNVELSGFVADLASSNEDLKRELAQLEKLVAPTPEEQAELQAEIDAEVCRAKAEMARAAASGRSLPPVSADKTSVGATPIVASAAGAPCDARMLATLVDGASGPAASAGAQACVERVGS